MQSPDNTTAPESPESPESPASPKATTAPVTHGAPRAPKKSGRRPRDSLTPDDCVSTVSVRDALEEVATCQQEDRAFKEWLDCQPKPRSSRSSSKRKRPVSSVKHHDQNREECRLALRKRKEQRQSVRKRKEQRQAARKIKFGYR